MKKFLLFALVFTILFGTVGLVFADTISLPNPLCPRGLNPQGQPVDPNNCINDIPRLIERISGFLTTIIASLAVLMFVWSGILFVLSAVNPGYLDKAKSAIWWAVVGTAIALAAGALTAVISAVIGESPAP